MPSFLHSGDVGDLLYGLPVIRALGGGDIYLVNRPWTRTRWGVAEIENLRVLFEAQDYIGKVALHDGEFIDHDLTTFRNGGYRLGDTIYERQRRWLRAEATFDSWLTVVPKKVSPIVISRAPRWQGYVFPWREIVAEFGDLCVFVGFREEHEAFVRVGGFIPFFETRDLGELAQVICGAELFIGGQSAALALANALGKETLVEVCPHAPDCFYPKGQYCLDGGLSLAFAGRVLETKPSVCRRPEEALMIKRAREARLHSLSY